MAAQDKDTIYVDIDDEITTIIDKVRSSEGKVVALVLPKRASVFQSIVNMKLLKRAVEAAKKHIVLVTTEANLMPLAGAVGLHVAATPQSKPEVPAAAEPVADEESADEPVDAEAYTAENAGNRPIGELASRSGHVVGGVAAEDAAVSLDDEEAAETVGPDGKKIRKNRHLKVPNFGRFRMRLFLAILGFVALVVGLYVCIVILPKATIAISTNTSSINVNLSPTLDTTASILDPVKLIVPAKTEQQQKTSSQQVDATGQKNNGDTATGSVDMTAADCTPPFSTPDKVPAGTGISTNGLTFITQSKATFSIDHASGSCVYYAASSIDMTAQNAGTKYNVSGATFSVAGRSDVTATGSATGGTDSIVKVISQADIDGAKQKLTTLDTTPIQATLEQALTLDGMYPLTTTFKAGTPVITTSANVGDAADNVTVTQAVTYTMFGAKKTDLDALIKAFVDTQIDAKTQTILNNGLSTATINVVNANGATMQISLQTVAVVGPDLNVATIKQQAANKRIGDVKSMIDAIPGVTSVDVQLSPFWVSTVPSNPHQVIVTIDKGH